MSLYTEDNLSKVLKKDLITIILVMQSKTSADNAEVLEEVRKSNSKFDIMQCDLVVAKKVTSELNSRLASMECQCWANAHYLRRECLEIVVIPKEVEQKECLEIVVIPKEVEQKECLEIVVIPKEVKQKDLEGKVRSVLEKVGCRIDPDNIEDCHPLIKKSDNVKIKFSTQKYCQYVLWIKRDL